MAQGQIVSSFEQDRAMIDSMLSNIGLLILSTLGERRLDGSYMHQGEKYRIEGTQTDFTITDRPTGKILLAFDQEQPLILQMDTDDLEQFLEAGRALTYQREMQRNRDDQQEC
jgi:hypothetical protein